MTTNDLDRQLTSWLGEGRPARPPEGLFEAAAARVTTTRRRPAWVIPDRWTWRRAPGLGMATLPLRQAAVLLALAALIATIVGVLTIGSLPRPPARIPADRGTFRPVAPMAFVRESSTATTLKDGRVLVVGGWPADGVTYSVGGDYPASVRTADVWDPATETFTRTGDLAAGRFNHVAVLLRDGRVLVIGGQTPGTTDPDGNRSYDQTPTAEAWDPATGRFAPAGRMAAPMTMIAAWLEPDGRVRVVGVPTDLAPDGDGPMAAETWDPATMASSPAAVDGSAMPGIELGGGRRLWADGDAALMWDSATRTVQPVTSLPPNATKSMLPDGRVLVAGGAGGVDVGRRQDKTIECGPQAQLWDPVSNVFATTGPLGLSRCRHTAAVLPDGRVLLVGNEWASDDPWTAEVFELR